jgi:NitT/TauT family transport system ATP-binding protein
VSDPVAVAAPLTPDAVRLTGLVFRYGQETTPIFDGFDWRVSPGEVWAVVGPSGCGKSTLLYLLAGLRRPQAGELLVAGYPVPRPRASTGLILQDHGLLPWATVRDNATLGLRIGSFYRNKQGPPGQPRPYPPLLPPVEADRWLERLGIDHLANKYPAQLSGGQRQRVAIARALALRPDLLLMDEPFSSLDAAIRHDLQRLVLELQAELGLTTIIVTHSVEEAAFLGRRILLMRQPPNQEARILDNPAAGRAERTPATATLAALRGHLDAPARAGGAA